MVFRLVKRILKNRTASPLVEEGILLSLTVVSLAVVLSLIVSLFGGIDNVMGGANEAMNSFFSSALRSLDDLVRQLNSLFTG
ncbi:MAG: hypothetical protein DRJ98_03885 [Thermoprotei archaeon]|nr:MAG: hypothetical protein DRJ98_03885 [Thermoprotei archaeon]